MQSTYNHQNKSFNRKENKKGMETREGEFIQNLFLEINYQRFTSHNNLTHKASFIKQICHLDNFFLHKSPPISVRLKCS